MKTTTGIWSVQYNAENRPITLTNNESNTVVECTYDCMGRRATKKVTENGSITLNQRYIYRGYLQIAVCDLTRTGHPCLWLILWDPIQPIATRPLSIQKDGTRYTYGWDLTKNICEVFGSNGYIRTAYTYTPYGFTTSNGDTTQPLQWSSEYADNELGMVSYCYRYYNFSMGRWVSRDLLDEKDVLSLYLYGTNSPIDTIDHLGMVNINACHSISYKKKAKLPKWVMYGLKSFGLHKVEGSVSVSGSFCRTNCRNYDTCGIKLSLSGSYSGKVEVGSPEIKTAILNGRLGWYGMMSASGNISYEYSTCDSKLLKPPTISPEIRIELGLVLEMTLKPKILTVESKGGLGVIFTPRLNVLSSEIVLAIDAKAYVKGYFSVSSGMLPWSYSRTVSAKTEKGKLLEVYMPISM